MRYTLRAVLAVAMLLGVYALALGVIGGLLYAVYQVVVHGFTGMALVKLVLLAGVVSVAVGRGLWAGLRRHGDDDEPGVVLTELDQPRLWTEVCYLAEQVDTRPPDEIRLVPDVNAAVSETSRWLGLVPGVRRMYVGVPLLVGLTSLQMRSVLAHELGHYSGRHTSLSGVTYRGQESLRRIILHLGPGSWLGRPFGWYARLYVAVASSVNRRQELEADAYSARLAGKGVAISALKELPAIAAAWSFFVENYASSGSELRRRPRELFAGFQQLWTTPERQQQLDEFRADPAPEERSVYDTHPTTPERVDLLSRLDAPDEADDSGPAMELLHHAPATLRRLEEWMYAGTPATAAPWEELFTEGLTARTRSNAAALIEAMEDGGDTQGDLGQALEALRLGWAADLVAPLMPEEAADEERRLVAGRLVGELVADALVHSGRASYRFSWAEARPLVDGEGKQLDPWSPAHDAAMSEDAVPALMEWCERHEVPLDHRPAPPTAPAGAASSKNGRTPVRA